MGAWIETEVLLRRITEPKPSHPMWVRGLKLNLGLPVDQDGKSHPMWVRGLKPYSDSDNR